MPERRAGVWIKKSAVSFCSGLPGESLVLCVRSTTNFCNSRSFATTRGWVRLLAQSCGAWSVVVHAAQLQCETCAAPRSRTTLPFAVYIAIPVVVVGAVGANVYGCARAFNVSQNLVANKLHGRSRGQQPAAYPWPPNGFAEESRHSNLTGAGTLVGVVAFAAAFRFQQRTVFKALQGAFKKPAAEATRSVGAFLADSAPGGIAVVLNSLASSMLAGALTPVIDGDSRPKTV